MADQKWSGSAFPVRGSFANDDYVMGLTAGNKNAKYSAGIINAKILGPASSVNSTVFVADGTTGKIAKSTPVTIDGAGNIVTPGSTTQVDLHVSGIPYLPNTTSNQLEVSLGGSDTTGDGSYWRPYKTVEFADSFNQTSVNIAAGTFTETAISTGLSSWNGSGKDATKVSCGLLTLNDTLWQAATTPSKLFQNLTVFNGSGTGTVIDLTLTASGSAYTSSPSVGFSGGGGTGAAATAILGKSIASIAITSPGSYTFIPTVSATLGSGATFAPAMSALSVSVVNPGTNYAVNSKILASGGVSSDYAVLNVDSIDTNGGITGLSIVSGGSYTTLPINPISDTTTYTDCYVATTAPLIATYTDGPDGSNPGVGATIVNSGIVAPLFIDGLNIPDNARVLVWTMPNSRFNGIYTVFYNGASGGNWQLNRATDFDEPIEITKYAKVNITNGSTYQNTIFNVTSFRPVQIGTAGGVINFATAPGSLCSFSLNTYGINSVAVTAGGTNYETTSSLVISGSGGAAGTITLAASGVVKRLTLDVAGSGYSSAPTVSFTGGGGTGATATAIVSPLTGSLNLTPSAYKSGSAYIFNNFRFPNSAIVGLASNVIINRNCEANNLNIDSVVQSNITAQLTGSLILSAGNVAVTSQSHSLDSLLITDLVINISAAITSVSVTITNCTLLNTITVTNPNSVPVTINIDDVSFPSSWTLVATTVNLLSSTYSNVTVTGNKTLTMNDFNVEQYCTAAANITIPPHSLVPFPIGTVIPVSRITSGVVTLVAGAGVTLLSISNFLSIANTNGTVYAQQTANDTWKLTGNVGP